MRSNRWWLLCVTAALLFGLVGGASAQTVEIRFIGMEYYEWSADWYQQAARDFEAENPGIRVRVEVVPWDMGFERYITLIRAGAAPDVGGGGAKWTAEFAAMGALEPLEGYMSPEFEANVVAPFLQAMKIEGSYFGLPLAASARTLLYNVDLFARAGVEAVPATWEEFRAALAKVVAETDAYGLALNLGDHESIWNLRHFTLAAGAEWFDEGDGWQLDTPENAEALAFIADLVASRLTQPNPIGSSREEAQRLFIEGRAAAIPENPEIIGRIQSENPDMRFDVIPFPELRAPGSLSIIDSVYMFSGSQNKEEAWQFLEFLFSFPVHYDWAARTGFFGGTVDVSEVWPEGEFHRKFVDLLPVSKMYPVQIGWDVIEEEMRKATQATVLGQAPGEALRQAQRAVEARIR